MELFATPAEAVKDLVRVVGNLGFNYEVVRVRYQHEGGKPPADEVAGVKNQPDFPVRERTYEGDKWSSESSNDDDDPMWRVMWPQLPPWMRNPANWEGGGQKQCGMPIVFQL